MKWNGRQGTVASDAKQTKHEAIKKAKQWEEQKNDKKCEKKIIINCFVVTSNDQLFEFDLWIHFSISSWHFSFVRVKFFFKKIVFFDEQLIAIQALVLYTEIWFKNSTQDGHFIGCTMKTSPKEINKYRGCEYAEKRDRRRNGIKSTHSICRTLYECTNTCAHPFRPFFYAMIKCLRTHT